MAARRFVFILLLLAIRHCGGQNAIYAVRSLSADSASGGMLLEVSISLNCPGAMPAAWILEETLPQGLQFQGAVWNGKPFAPSLQQNQTLKWFFGPGGQAVSEGILIYQIRVHTDAAQKVFFAGSLQCPGAAPVPVTGERILWLNQDECAAPVFSPASKMEFEEELEVSLHVEAPAGAEIFLCFGEPVFWDDWQLYEGAFLIQHSLQLHAQTWFADGRASLTAYAEYHRRRRCEITLQQGWNLIANPLNLSKQECLKFRQLRCFSIENGTLLDAENPGISGQVFWVFSEEPGSLSLSGLEPFQCGMPTVCKPGWEAVSPVGLEDNIIQPGKEIFWAWEDNRYQPAKILQPGKGYWRFTPPFAHYQ